jgi:hypothetical protein
MAHVSTSEKAENRAMLFIVCHSQETPMFPEIPKMKKLTGISRMNLSGLMRLGLVALSLGGLLMLGGCASTAEGITRALIDNGKEQQPRLCKVSGPAFKGIEARLDNESGELAGNTLRVVLVHGIGTHDAGWSLPLMQRLVAKLGLNSIDRQIKRVDVLADEFPGETLGQVVVMRFFDRQSATELIAYELTWSAITAERKRKLAYDTSAVYSDSRAEFNQNLKVFLNDRAIDPVAYLGESQERIRVSAGKALCMSSLPDWRMLPESGELNCQFDKSMDLAPLASDELIFITHSLGSRILSDALRFRIARMRERLNEDSFSGEDRAFFSEYLELLQNKHTRIYMMANQLPLIDAAFQPPDVTGQIADYCEPDGMHYDKRIFNRLSVVAFSDPNDPLSYGLPFNYANERMDSRLCPAVINVSINVTDVLTPLGLTEIASPLEAHVGYAMDETVLQIMLGGVGTETMFDRVAQKCTWIDIE